MRTRIAACIVTVLSLVLLGSAQSNRGNIIGTVTNAAGTALPGVRVALTGSSPSAVAITNERGEFSFRNLAPGLYETRVELAGFATVISKVSVRSGRTERLSIKMQAGPPNEARSVNDAAQNQQRESSVIAGVVGGIPMA